MFAFFKNGNLEGVWGNQKGDIFFNLTCQAKNWNPKEMSLVWYETDGGDYQFMDILPDKIVFYEAVQQGVNEQNEPVYVQGDVAEEVPAEIFVENGLMVKAC